jgi:hypothetical protein
VWLHRLLVCNPCFLASAALLLYGMYRISVDASFLATEVSQLTFNFTALQCYELLLVGTAMLLAGRKIWYDASLLVVIENLFVLVPFILVSQAALIEQPVVWKLCAAATVIAVVRQEGLRRRLRELWPASGFFALGAVVLVANAALPVVYRHLHEAKIGTKLAAGPAWEVNQLTWLGLLPLLVALVNLLPPAPADTHPLGQRRWFPWALAGGWLAGTAVHLYSLGYVYDFDLSRHLVAPVLWVLGWTGFRKLPDFAKAPAVRATAMALPLPLALVAAGANGSHVFAGLMVANLLIYGWLVVRAADRRLPLQLALLSAATLVAGAPVDWLFPWAAGFNRSKLITLAFAIYGGLGGAFSRNPKAGLAGALLATLGGLAALANLPHGGWWAGQIGFSYFLLHSLRWHDAEHAGASGVRGFIAAVWVLHTLGWARAGANGLSLSGLPILILAVTALHRWLKGRWLAPVVPIAAGVALLIGPSNRCAGGLNETPTGVLAVAASFTLFALGAALALTKSRWHRLPPERP